MAEKEAMLYQGNQERGFREKAGWYATALGIVALGFGFLGRSNNLIALGLVMTAGGIILGNAPK